MNIPEQRFSKITQANAQLLCQPIELNEVATALLQECPISADYIQQLVDKKFYTDAVKVLAHALPKREATWWACLCARKTLTEKSLATENKAIELAEAWVYKPSE
ncbi:MAG: secreted protein, partial [Methylococcaceae bacterium NSP1-2]